MTAIKKARKVLGAGIAAVVLGIAGGMMIENPLLPAAFAQSNSGAATGQWKTIEFTPAEGEDLKIAKMLLTQDLGTDEDLTNDAFITTARIDLDNDTNPELLIRLVNPGFCGAAGKCLTYVFYQKDPRSAWVRLLSFYGDKSEYFDSESGIESLRIDEENIFTFRGGRYISE